MHVLDPSDEQELKFSIYKAVRLSGLSNDEICNQLKKDFGVKITSSGLSHALHRGSVRLQRALQILAVCGVTKVEIKTKAPR